MPPQKYEKNTFWKLQKPYSICL